MSEKPSPIREPKRRGRFADFFVRLWREKPLGTFCGMIVLLLIFVAIFAHVLAPYEYSEPHLEDRLAGPSARYLLGTDQLGRDFLSRLIVGARLSIFVGLAATTVNVVVALLVGGISGFIGGKLDLAVQRFVDAWMAFPGLLLLLTVMSIVGQGLLQYLCHPLISLTSENIPMYPSEQLRHISTLLRSSRIFLRKSMYARPFQISSKEFPSKA